ncbi:MAG: hypothetical protein H0V92_08985 [Pseudonocardiales bacterium]|nr:hypothetical protein [Pseudonocardiales bacterium]
MIRTGAAPGADRGGALFAEVLEQVETELTAQVSEIVAGSDHTDPLAALALAAEAWLDAFAEPDLHRIVLIDAPSVLGWTA